MWVIESTTWLWAARISHSLSAPKKLRDTQFVLALRKYHHVIITEMALAKLIKDFNCLGLELDELLGQLDLW